MPPWKPPQPCLPPPAEHADFKPQAKFQVLEPEALRERRDTAIGQVVELLCVSKAEAERVLRHYRW